jgi:hypothetical protein
MQQDLFTGLAFVSDKRDRRQLNCQIDLRDCNLVDLPNVTLSEMKALRHKAAGFFTPIVRLE